MSPHGVCVVGSLNSDLVVHTPRFPGAGETVMGDNFRVFPGGKGANQAVAAARMGAQVSMIGCVGDDDYGRMLRETLSAEGIDTRHVVPQRGVPTGVAVITVASDGRNTIVVAPGANATLSPPHIQHARAAIESAETVLMQLEVPMRTVLYAATLARDAGREVVLNAAPAAALPGELLPLLDTLIVNESEAAAITGLGGSRGGGVSGEQLLDRLEGLGVRTVVVTLGERGLAYVHAGARGRLPAFPVRPVDTVGAGDAFAGTLAATMSPREQDLRESLRWAAAAGALATTRHGAIPSLPRRDEVAALLASHPPST
jgi:ribokinase